jgi:hypothetical protein
MKRKGQAFETMMLVISVIVAIAILGILLSFLGNVSIIGAEASQVVPGMVKDVYNKGYGIEIEDEVDFQEGDVLTPDDLTGQLFPKDQLKVECVDDATCGDSDAMIEVDDDNIYVNKNGKASVAVCPDESGDGDSYLVVIGRARNVEDVREACTG